MINNLTGWHTTTKIQAALGFSVNSLRSKAARAHKRGEEWVRTEPLPCHPYRRWLINTDSSQFKAYVQARQASPREKDAFDPFVNDSPSWSVSAANQESLTQTRQSGSFVPCNESWPELCQWLLEEGTCVFRNALEKNAEAPWQWRWGSLSGNGCSSEESAILAALRAKIELVEFLAGVDLGTLEAAIAAYESDPPSISFQTPVEPQPSLSSPTTTKRLWFSTKKNRDGF